MADVGVVLTETFLAALLAIAPAAALGGLLGTWWVRRQELPEAAHEERREPVSDVEQTAPVPSLPAPRAESEDDLSTEDTVALRIDRKGSEEQPRSVVRSVRRWLGDEG
jgi:hypothetical protein